MTVLSFTGDGNPSYGDGLPATWAVDFRGRFGDRDLVDGSGGGGGLNYGHAYAVSSP